MRAAFVGMFVVIAVVSCLAQADVPAQPSDSNPTLQVMPRAQERTFQIDRAPVIIDHGQEVTLPNGEILRYRIHPPEGTCYTMRAYLFSPGTVGSAPRRTGYMTCVPSNALQMRQTRRPPRVRLLPQ